MHRGLQSLLLAGILTSAIAPAASAQPPDARGNARGPRTDALGDPLPYFARLRLGSLRFRHPSGVAELALSPDEKIVVTIGNHGGPLIAWDAVTGKELWRDKNVVSSLNLSAASYGTRALAFAPDGSFYTSAPRRQALPTRPQALNWNAESGSVHPVNLDAPPPAVANNGVSDGSYRAIDVSPDGRRVALGNERGLYVCTDRGKTLFKISNQPREAVDVNGDDRLMFGGHYSYGRFAPDGKSLAVVLSEAPNEVRLVDAENGKEHRRIALASRLVRMDFSPDSQRLVATERDNAVRAYDSATGKRLWEHIVQLTNPYENYTSAIAVAPGGKSIAVAATDNNIRLLNAATGEEQGVLTGHTWYPWTLAFNRDGSMLYSSGWDGAVRRWDVAKREQLPLPQGTRATGVVGLSPNGRTLAYEDDAGGVHIVDAATGDERRRLGAPDAQYSQLVYSPDSRRLAGGGTRGDQVHLNLWDLATGETLRRWDWPKGRDPHSKIEALCFTPDGRRLAAAVFRQSMAYLWDVETDKQVAAMKHEEVYGLSISPDGKTLATAGWDSTLRLWSVEDGALEREIDVKEFAEVEKPAQNLAQWMANDDPDLRMYAVSYAPIGGLLATQHMNGEIWVWDAGELNVLRKIPVNSSFGYGSLAFSPDGLWVATGTSGGDILVWDAATGENVWCNQAHGDTVYVLNFGRDGHTLASGGDDGVCYLWDLHALINALPREMINRDLLGNALPPGELLDPKSADAMWKALAGFKSVDAYKAIAVLAREPDRAVELIAEKMRRVTALIDPDKVDPAATPEAAERMRRLQRQLIAKDPTIEHTLVARRAIALLYQLRTPAAIQLLEEFAARDPEGELGRFTSSALARLANERNPNP